MNANAFVLLSFNSVNAKYFRLVSTTRSSLIPAPSFVPASLTLELLLLFSFTFGSSQDHSISLDLVKALPSTHHVSYYSTRSRLRHFTTLFSNTVHTLARKWQT